MTRMTNIVGIVTFLASMILIMIDLHDRSLRTFIFMAFCYGFVAGMAYLTTRYISNPRSERLFRFMFCGEYVFFVVVPLSSLIAGHHNNVVGYLLIAAFILTEVGGVVWISRQDKVFARSV